MKKYLIDKGKVDNVLTVELQEAHGCFERGRQFVGCIGGQIMQWYFVINAIFNNYKDNKDLAKYYERLNKDPTKEDNRAAQHPRELLLEHLFVPFLLGVLKELKRETMQFMIMPKML